MEHAARPAVAPRRITGPPALAAIVSGGVIVAGLWWKDTAFVVGWAGWLTNAGRITGLECGYGVVVLLALMARVPALERGVGTDRLARWHAMGGRYIVGLAVAHTLLITWGYSLTSHRGLLGETADLNTRYADVLMATVAMALFLLVGVTSARAARRRLAYETWHLVHLYTYLAIALSFSHQFATGADFVDLRARVLWSVLYLTVAVVLIRYRLAAPLLSSRRHHFRVLGVRPESADSFSVIIGGRDLHRLSAESGQFFRWRFLTRELWWVAGPYSLSAPPRPDRMRITVRIAGAHSAALARLTPGTRVIVEGPYGGFTAARRRRRRVLLIGGGVGITPLRALFETLPGSAGDITLVYRASQADDLLLRGELEAIAAHRGAVLHYLTGPRGRGPNDPLSAPALSRFVGDSRDIDVYLCGPDGMTDTVRAALKDLRVPAARIHHEAFAF